MCVVSVLPTAVSRKYIIVITVVFLPSVGRVECNDEGGSERLHYLRFHPRHAPFGLDAYFHVIMSEGHK